MFRRVFQALLSGTTTRKNFLAKLTTKTCRHYDKHIPCRAMLYVPGSDMNKMTKAFTYKVDYLVLNCEDGVAVNQKDEARKNVREVLDTRPPTIKCNLSVRVNELNSPFFENDMKTFLTGKVLPDTFLLPKIHEPEDVAKIADIFEKYKPQGAHVNVMLFIESAKGVMFMREICMEAYLQGGRCNFTPIGLIFGGDDYLASVGAIKTRDHNEILYARQKVVNVAKAFQLQAIDIVHINYKDLDELEEQCVQGARMGYTGKQCIHPMQIETVQKCFSPSRDEIEWASALLKEFEKQEHHGKGAFTFRGSMIDAPLMKQAKNIINLSQRD